jgi:hypothetical protein
MQYSKIPRRSKKLNLFQVILSIIVGNCNIMMMNMTEYYNDIKTIMRNQGDNAFSAFALMIARWSKNHIIWFYSMSGNNTKYLKTTCSNPIWILRHTEPNQSPPGSKRIEQQ